MKNKYKITKLDMLSNRPAIVYGYGETAEEAIKNAPLRCNEITFEMEKVISVELCDDSENSN
jgi:hypothetical protein